MFVRVFKPFCTSKSIEYATKHGQLLQIILNQNKQIQSLQKLLKSNQEANKIKNQQIHEMRLKLTKDIQKGDKIWEQAKKKSHKNKMQAMMHFSKSLMELGELFKEVSKVEKQQHFLELKQGFQMTSRLFFTTLEKYKIFEFELKVGDKFVKEKMSVVGEEKGQKSQVGTIAKIVQKGWSVEDQILKLAKVIVYN